MAYDTGIADRLRAAGLKVVEIAGWKTRGSSTFNPRGSVDHHTAGPRSGNAPSLNICINGRRDLPGPLCHVLIGRDNTCYVIAAGRANHAGTGGWRGLSGNSTVYGIERENVGTTAEPWRPDQTDTAARAHAALIRGRANAEMLCLHKEWTTRKPDAHTITGSALRALVARYLANPTPNNEEFLMALSDAEQHELLGTLRNITPVISFLQGNVHLLTGGGDPANHGGAVGDLQRRLERIEEALKLTPPA